jgi:Arc/MetJ-type ribon-helix-helix transcriptional regulator
MLVSVRDLVDVELYPDEESVIRDALRSLLRTRPEMRLELAVRRYEAEEDLSLARAGDCRRQFRSDERAACGTRRSPSSWTEHR